MDANKYEYRVTTPFGEATYYKIEDVLDFVRLGIRQFQEITIRRQKMGAVVKDSLTAELTWQDIARIADIIGHTNKLSSEGFTRSPEEYYTEVLRRFKED